MRKLRELENLLVRGESVLAVILVLTMLALAGYNVLYRNVLVPLQLYWAHSGPPIERSVDTPDAAADAAATPADPGTPEPTAVDGGDKAGGDDFGGFGGGFDEGGDEPEGEEAKGDDFDGFGGGFGDEDEPEPKPEPKAEPAKPQPAGDDFGGFGGGFGEEDEPEPKPEPAPAPKPEPKAEPAGDDFGGFGGGFGEEDEPEPKPEPKAEPAGGDDFGGFGGGFDEGGDDAKVAAAEQPEPDEPEDDDLGDDDFGDEDEFANLPSIDAVAESHENDGPVGGPPPEGSFAAWGVEFVDSVKLEWIDVFLRQLVIIVAFLGATLATHRRKHINIDALSRALPKSAQRVVPIGLNLVSLSVCLLLAQAGWDLVKIGREFPVELTPWAEEWKFQLMFPVGFGLLAVHFAIRVVESIVDPPAEEPPVPSGAALAETDDPDGADDNDGADEANTSNDDDGPDADADADADEAEAAATDDEAEQKGGQS